MVQVSGGLAGPDGAGGRYQNQITTDRAAWWQALGGRPGVIQGATLTPVAGQLAVDVSGPFFILVPELQVTGPDFSRGYAVWSDATVRVPFDPPSAASRVDALLALFVDAEDAPLGTTGTPVGAHIVAAAGTSGSASAVAKADIIARYGMGGYYRLANVTVPAAATQIAAADMNVRSFNISRNRNRWTSILGAVTASAGWAITQAWAIQGRSGTMLEIEVTRTGATITALAGGGISGASIPIFTGLPVEYRPDADRFGGSPGRLSLVDRDGSMWLNSAGTAVLESLNGSSSITSGTTGIRLTFSYFQNLG
jgi:hypothetical protein